MTTQLPPAHPVRLWRKACLAVAMVLALFGAAGPAGAVAFAQSAGMVFVPLLVAPPPSTAYYVDCTGGNDANSGKGEAAAWKSLAKARTAPLAPGDRRRVRDGRPAGPTPHIPEVPAAVQRRVSCRGAIMVAGQRIQVGAGHAGLTVTITAVGDSFQIYDEDRLLTEARRRTTKPIARLKARKPELPRQRSARISGLNDSTDPSPTGRGS